jgi:hypothetical protein
MLLTLIFPEIMVGLALVDWCSARESARAMKEIAALDGVEWTRIRKSPLSLFHFLPVPRFYSNVLLDSCFIFPSLDLETK